MGRHIGSTFLFGNYDISMKYPPPLAVTNLRQETCWAHKVASPVPTRFFFHTQESGYIGSKYKYN